MDKKTSDKKRVSKCPKSMAGAFKGRISTKDIIEDKDHEF